MSSLNSGMTLPCHTVCWFVLVKIIRQCHGAAPSLELYEKLGDLFSDLRAYFTAAAFYDKQVRVHNLCI